MLSGNNEEGRLNFMYSIFDVDLNGKIEKEEMRNILHMYLESLMAISYEN
jgi:Ca2+-binding EF-hand superfamily protein